MSRISILTGFVGGNVVDLSEWLDEDAHGEVKRRVFPDGNMVAILFNELPVQCRIRKNYSFVLLIIK
jgi:hypothetical protein